MSCLREECLLLVCLSNWIFPSDIIIIEKRREFYSSVIGKQYYCEALILNWQLVIGSTVRFLTLDGQGELSLGAELAVKGLDGRLLQD